MNKICEFKKIVYSFFGAIFFGFICMLSKCLNYFDFGIGCFFVLFLYFFFYIISSIPIYDMILESDKLIFVSLFKIKEVDLKTLHITSVYLTPKGPRFAVGSKSFCMYCFFTEDNYEVLKKLILMNKVDISLEKLDRMVKYSFFSIKRNKKQQKNC